MGKRKRSSSDIIDKLINKLAKKRKRIISSSSSSEESLSDDNYSSPTPTNTNNHNYETQDDALPKELPEGQLLEEDLDPDILQLLGSDPTQEKSFGENLHKDLAVRWKHILTNGLSREDKVELLKKYLPAENCTHMKAPKINPEITSALSAISVKKDSYSEYTQNQLASCISAVGKALSLSFVQKNNIPQEIVKLLSDAGRLLCDTHFRQSLSRRFEIVNCLSKQNRDVIKNTKIDDYLFGPNLAEHLKSSKAISTSAAELKLNSAKPKQLHPQPSTSARQPRTLNARGALRASAAEPRAYPNQQSRRSVLSPTRSPARRDYRRYHHSRSHAQTRRR